MDRLSILITLFTGAVVTGALVIAAFTFGYYGWAPILGAVAIGWILAWPLAYLISRKIKREDPDFDHRQKTETKIIPDPDAREI